MNEYSEKAFTGKLEFLSNFYPARIVMGDLVFPTSEHLYNFMKMDTEEGRAAILSADTPLKAKRLSKKFHVREDWDAVKVNVMREVVGMKFNQHPELMAKLKKVKGQITEVNYWNDTFWGVCNGEGLNHLGKILMALRDGRTED